MENNNSNGNFSLKVSVKGLNVRDITEGKLTLDEFTFEVTGNTEWTDRYVQALPRLLGQVAQCFPKGDNQ